MCFGSEKSTLGAHVHNNTVFLHVGPDGSRNEKSARRKARTSGEEVLVFPVEAAGGAQERLTGAVCALTLQALRGLGRPCGGDAAARENVETGERVGRNGKYEAARAGQESLTYRAYSSIPIEQESGPRAGEE